MSAGDQNCSRATRFKCLSDPTVTLSVRIADGRAKEVSRLLRKLSSRVISTIGFFDQLSKDACPNLKLAAIATGAHTQATVRRV
jgi:hypothetical protein